MICKIADFCVEIIPKYRTTQGAFLDFICKEPLQTDFTIEVTEEEIDAEAAFEDEDTVSPESVKRVKETFAIFRRFCAEVLKRDAFLMHGVALEYEGNGYIFTAQSGTGKTTHSLLWKKVFGEDKVTIVNGDKPIIRIIDGKVYAYGTPWNGKEHLGTTGRTELRNICFVSRAESNSIEKISVAEAIPLLFSQIMISDSTDLARQLELADEMLDKTSLYLLHCNMDDEAAYVAYEGMKE